MRMMPGELFHWLAAIGAGFLLGSVMFSEIIPRRVLHIDIEAVSDDGNPGSGNVFLHCGPFWGFVCLLLDMAKGFLPVFCALHRLGPNHLLFCAVLAAPVLGHAIAPFNHFHGGKCIATAFGELIALLPVTWIVLVLAGVYILLSTVMKIPSTRVRSIAAFSLFGIIAAVLLVRRSQLPIALGCVLISTVAVVRHRRPEDGKTPPRGA